MCRLIGMSKYTEYLHRQRVGYMPEFYTVDKLPSGMQMEFSFAYAMRTLADGRDELIIYPSITVYKKRKKAWPDDPKATTGRDGLYPAMTALQRLKKLEKPHMGDYAQLRVCISWHDNRRRDAYAKVLGKRGYYFDHWDGEKVLTKVVKRDKT